MEKIINKTNNTISNTLKEQESLLDIHDKFQKIKLYNKIYILNFLTIEEKVNYFFKNRKLLKYLIPHFSRKSMLIFQDILKKNPYISGIKLKKVFQFYYENKNYSNSDIFAAIFLYVIHLNETHDEIILDFPLLDQEDYFHTSNFPLRYFLRDNISILEKDFDRKFVTYNPDGIKQEFSNVNEILAEIVDPKKTVFNITDNSAFDKYLGKKIFRINLLYFSKRGHSLCNFFNHSSQHLIFPKVECVFENFYLGDNILDFNKNSFFKRFKNKIKNLYMEIYAEYNLIHYNPMDIHFNNDDNNEENVDKISRFLELDNFVKNNLSSIEKIIIYVNNSLVSFFMGVFKNFIRMLQIEKPEKLEKIKIAKYYSNNKTIFNNNIVMFNKNELSFMDEQEILNRIENTLSTSMKNKDRIIINGNQIKINLDEHKIISYEEESEMINLINSYRDLKCLKIIFKNKNYDELFEFIKKINNQKIKKIWLSELDKEEINKESLFITLRELVKNNVHIWKFKIESNFLLKFNFEKKRINFNENKITDMIFKSNNKDFYFSEVLEKLKFLDTDININLKNLYLYGKMMIYDKNENHKNFIYLKNLEKIFIENLATFEFFKELYFLKTENLHCIYFEEPSKKYFEQIQQYIEFDEINDKYINYLNHLKYFTYIIIDSKYDDVGQSVLSSHLFLDKKLNFSILKLRMNRLKYNFDFY